MADTVIGSATLIASGDITDTNSAIFYSADNLLSKHVTFAQLQDAGLGQLGARLSLSASLPMVAATTQTASLDTTDYDFGGWVHPTSMGLLRVPDDHWDFVMVGYNHQFTNGNDGHCWIDINGATQYGLPRTYSNLVTTGQTYKDCGNSAPIQVSSGDYFRMRIHTSVVGSLIAGDDTFFWIMPWRARL